MMRRPAKTRRLSALTVALLISAHAVGAAGAAGAAGAVGAAGAAQTVGAGGLPPVIPLWPGGTPGAAPLGGAETVRVTDGGEHIVSNVHVPSITAYIPATAKGACAAIVVIPGGGHQELWMDHEGYRVAEYLAARGIAAFVLKYRLARAKGSVYTIAGHALPDVQRAIRLVRSEAAKWHIDPQRIGVMGFSAGGELAALAAAGPDVAAGTDVAAGPDVAAGSNVVAGSDAGAIDPVDRQSSRPNFQALIYPAIPKGLTFSAQSPPAFLLAGNQDTPAISAGLAQLYLDMRHAGARAELHLYEGVGHGFGLRSSNAGPVAAWPQRFVDWLEASNP
jgi:acetyl esterase/lipase